MIKYCREITFSIKDSQHKIPCLSTEHCVDPPVVGQAVSVTTTDVPESEWLKSEAEFECIDPEALFYEEEIEYAASFSLQCEKNLILGGKFPYWKIPGTDYPKKTEIVCAHTKKCYNFAEFNRAFATLGLSDTFDNYHYEMDSQYEYFCSNENRGKRFFLVLSISN